MDNTKLKPCPFCGGTAVLESCTTYSSTFYGVRCTGCGAFVTFIGNEKKNFSGKAWNGRVKED